MNSICKDIFKAIHEGKWLKIEYCNKQGIVTKYWIGILSLNVPKRMLRVDGMHQGTLEVEELNIYIDSIQSTSIVEGTYCPINRDLVNDIAMYPDKYSAIFSNTANLKILNYLEMCNKMDTMPYFTDYELIHYIDRESFTDDEYYLDEKQFAEIVRSFSEQTERSKKQNKIGKIHIKRLAINVLSINTKKGLYLLAYRGLDLDIKRRTLVPEMNITLCTEFLIDGSLKESIRKFLDGDDYELLNDFEENQELIKDAISRSGGSRVQVDDIPYLIGVGRDIIVDFHSEYKAIMEMFENDTVTVPLKAFFGDLLDKPRRTRKVTIALLNNKVNIDQLLAINTAIKYPLAYIQGPPGTGKTSTILNTIITAFFQERTVLFSSHNNHPIDEVFYKLKSIKYKDKTIPFPVLRVGNIEVMKEAIVYIREQYRAVENIRIFGSTLDKRKGDRMERAGKLSQLLKEYEDRLDLMERKETLTRLIDYHEKVNASPALLPFEVDLQGRQLQQIQDALATMKNVTEEEALELIDRNEDEFLQYLYFTSARYIQKLYEPKYSDLINIIFSENDDEAVSAFNRYLSDEDNLKKLMKVYPIIISTCISAHRLGKPEPSFDMTIIDEASQCNTAVSLIPIIRGESLMLVGDPQQINPVILMDEITNQKLRREYQVSEEYDYRKNSIYKTFLAADSVSDEILLRKHYRCDPRIIGFNNRKYYDSRLQIMTEEKDEQPLIFVDIRNFDNTIKNTSRQETEQILQYVLANKDKSIGIITPFANQRDMISQALKENRLDNVACGTVHAFQGDEKDVILFSMTIGDSTMSGTYRWLKSNRELLNVATSRAKEKLIVLADSDNVERLHNVNSSEDDLYELLQYVKSNGKTVVTPKETTSRALGIKPFSTETENAFLACLTHALENIGSTMSKYVIHKEVPISQVFQDNIGCEALFYTGRFDFVVYEKTKEREIPVLAIELDGKEHLTEEAVRVRDEQKNRICQEHNLQLIRVENTYARRYNHIKSILIDFFASKR